MSEKLEVFKGFEISYPEYEIITPQTLNKFTIRSMSVAEEETLKGSFISPKSVPTHISKIIWTCLVKKPASIKTYEDFLNNVTILDRDALLYGLYHVTYKDMQNFDVPCAGENCGNKYSVVLDISKAFNMQAYKGKPEEILKKVIKIELKIVKNTSVEITQPTLKTEDQFITDALFQSQENMSIGSEMLPVIKFIQYEPNTDKSVSISERDNIFVGYKSLPAADRKLINKKYMEEFGNYRVKLTMLSVCPKCKHNNENAMDIIQNLFRALYE
jgi:hypothetical protein